MRSTSSKSTVSRTPSLLSNPTSLPHGICEEQPQYPRSPEIREEEEVEDLMPLKPSPSDLDQHLLSHGVGPVDEDAMEMNTDEQAVDNEVNEHRHDRTNTSGTFVEHTDLVINGDGKKEDCHLDEVIIKNGNKPYQNGNHNMDKVRAVDSPGDPLLHSSSSESRCACCSCTIL